MFATKKTRNGSRGINSCIKCASIPDGRRTASRSLLRARRDGRRTASRAVRRSRRERHLGLQRGGGNLPARGFWWFSQNRPPTGFASPIKTVSFLSGGTCGGITEDASMRSKVSKGSSPSDGWTYIFLILPLRAF